MKAKEMMSFLEQVIKTYGDIDVIIEVNDYSDSYSVKTRTGKINRAIATSELSTVSASKDIKSLNEVRLITDI